MSYISMAGLIAVILMAPHLNTRQARWIAALNIAMAIGLIAHQVISAA